MKCLSAQLQIILTVRDNADVWLNSFRRFYAFLINRHGYYAGLVESFLWCKGLAGPLLYNTVHISKYSVLQKLQITPHISTFIIDWLKIIVYFKNDTFL